MVIWYFYTVQNNNITITITTDWFQIGKGVRPGCMLSPCLFNLYAEAQAGIKIAGGKYQ